MKTLKPIYRLLIGILVIFCASCKKEISVPNPDISVKNKQVKDGPIPPYVFNWETSTYMPSASTQGVNPVPMPWNSGTTAIDPNIVNDYKSADGWVLVYNTFSPTTSLNDPNYVYFFTLYNVYRGELRFYLWQPASAIATTYVNHGLSLYGTQTSPMLNFNTQEIIDPTKSLPAFSQVLNQTVAATGGTWFAYQYEIEYDPNIPSTTFPATGLTLASQWANVSNINLNGSLTGSLKTATVGVPNADVNLQGIGSQGAITFFGTVASDVINGSTANPISAAISGAVSGVIKGFLSAVLGGSSSDKPINLTLNSTIKLTGSLVNNGTLENMKLVLPGQSNSQTANGNIPHYNQVLGVVNVSSKPVLQLNEDSFSVDITDPYDGSNQTDYGYDVTCWFDANTIKLNFNPAIINNTPTGATIQNINMDLIAILPATGSGTGGIFNSNQTTQEAVSTLNIASFHNPTATKPALFRYYTQVDPNEGFYAYTPQLAVRISFDVVPNNGGTKATIVKTFIPSKQLM